VRSRFAVFVVIVQSVLFLAHWFVYRTLTDFWAAPDPPGFSKLQVAFILLSVSFVAASLLAFRSPHALVRVFYTISAGWLGVLIFCLFAASSCWMVYAGSELLGLHPNGRDLVIAFFGLALLTGVYGMVNAARTRVKRITVKLPNLPESWRGRVAALVSDTHLGHIRNHGFARRIVAGLMRLRPDVVFITGDLFDGTAVDLNRLAEPWAGLQPPQGAYFVTGNHEEFSDPTRYLEAVTRSGVRVLNNEKVTLDGLQVVGVHYRDGAHPERFRSILQRAALDRDRASILLTHAPHRLPIAEEEGISLQLSGHTHGGQLFPFTWITSRIYGRFVYGLERLGNLLVYTSSGAGTWGPPLRVGTRPEIVLIQFA
jgi:predicted MPP superfamily phosphohydrolase